jgi:hypothetical protein
MTFAPEHIYNLYTTYDAESLGTKFALFYTVVGDTLVAGAGAASGNFIPDIYAKEYGTLNFSYSSPWATASSHLPGQEPHRSQDPRGLSLGRHRRRRRAHSYTKGREFSIGLSFNP